MKASPMSIEYGKENCLLRWIRNPFTGTVTYFNDIHRKTNSFRRLTSPQQVALSTPPPRSPEALQAEMTRVTNTCVFCPGNEAMTMEEVLRVTYGEIYTDSPLPASCSAEEWAIRVGHNIIPSRARGVHRRQERILCHYGRRPAFPARRQQSARSASDGMPVAPVWHINARKNYVRAELQAR
jgi:hypothetical protein